MASNGAEDLRRSSRPTFALQPKSAAVHWSNINVSSAVIERNRHYPSALSHSVSLPNVHVAYDRPHRFSGIYSQRHSSSVPRAATALSRVVNAQNTGARSPNSKRTPSIVSKSSPNISGLSSCHLEPIVQSYQARRHIDPPSLKSGLLGKRTFAPSPSIYHSCPSPPKTSSHRTSVKLKKTMPTNKSYPLLSSKLKSNSNGLVQPSSAKVPTDVKLERNPVEKSNGIIHAMGDYEADLIKPALTTVPKYTDVPINSVSVAQDNKIIEDTKENEHVVACSMEHGTSEAPQRVRKVSSEVQFTAAVQKLNKSMVQVSSGTLNGHSGPFKANSDSLCHRTAVKTGITTSANTLTNASLCLINGNGEFCMDTEPSAGLCSDISAFYNGVIQDSVCAIKEDVSTKMDSPQSPTVYFVTNQISAINLTKESSHHPSGESPSLCRINVDNRAQTHWQDFGQDSVVLVQDEEERPAELGNVCSDNYDGPDSDASSAISVATSSNIEEPMSSELEDDREVKPALVPSLFPFLPPTLYFSTYKERVEPLPPEQRKLLKWKMSTVTPNIVKHTVARSYFRATKKNHDWLGCWGHHMKSPGFKAIREYQKLNHFPGSFQIGRKDRLWRNLSKMQTRFGKREFGFFPRSFVLPQDMKLLKKAWEDGGSRQKWIIKPPASARGIGIQVIHKWSQMPRKRPLLVQKYLHKPYLISGNKFDLRIYVYVTSYDPLRVYIFNDGLVRFASCKYSSSMKSLNNKFMHLTNYSVNKKNSEYQTNSDDKACQGHKWALKALWQHLDSKGINRTLIWEKIKDMVMKTIIASDPYVNTLLKTHVRSPYSCHELFGFDIMLDENLKPWVLEVNISPSLHSNSPLDVSIKGQMIRDVLNLAGFVLPKKEDVVSNSSSTSSLCDGLRERTRSELSPDEKLKRAFYLTQRVWDQEFFSTVLDVLTPDDVRVLAESEDELTRQGEFERIFPSPASSRYLRFFEHQRYLNVLLNQWEQRYYQNRSKGIELLKGLCQKKVHLGNLDDAAHHWSSKNRPRSDLHSTKTELSKSSVTASQNVGSQLEDDDDDWSDEAQSTTSSIPDMNLMESESLSQNVASANLHHQDYQ
ncbi:tubulin polyglutamylase TTLL4 [Trichomycterus rosablanca]|uniref:tubulin polyglutamylase TTLL4 n=1 Tax=Trichomycterus rosablanca TaxID=2290929 RepID=UPI002F35B739